MSNIVIDKQHKELFVNVTDTKFTKKVKGFGTPDFTNIDTYYLIEEATKKFGLMGNWGLKNTEWEYQTFGTTTIAILKAVFYTPYGDFDMANSDKLCYVSKQGKEITDTDVHKKIITNTIAKGLSYIGFGTDIYLGKFEDTNYTNEVMNDMQLCNPDTLKVLRDLLQKHKVSADIVTKNFSIRALKDLLYKDFNKAVALIQQVGAKNDK